MKQVQTILAKGKERKNRLQHVNTSVDNGHFPTMKRLDASVSDTEEAERRLNMECGEMKRKILGAKLPYGSSDIKLVSQSLL